MHDHVRISDELTIHYVSLGEGRPLVFIPGWTMTTDSFEKNLGPLSRRFRAIACDPRSHGESSVVPSGNNFMRHGRDLAAFIGELGLRDAVLLGWSTGALTCYSYFQQFGCDNVSAFVNIDQSPKPLQDSGSDWGIGRRRDLRRVIAGVTAPDQSAMVKQFAMTVLGADEAFVDHAVASSLNTPPHIAALLLADSLLCDYRDVARDVAARLPVLYFVSEKDSGAANRWIEANTPGAEVCTLGGHMMFREYPEEFNREVLRFLDAHLPAQGDSDA